MLLGSIVLLAVVTPAIVAISIGIHVGHVWIAVSKLLLIIAVRYKSVVGRRLMRLGPC